MKFKFSKVNVAVLAFPILFWFLSSFPGKMTVDSLDVWSQVKSGQFNDWHTVAYGYFVYVFSLGGRYLAMVSLTQATLAYLAVFKLISALFADKTFGTKLKISSIIFLLPFIGSISVTLWKDVPYAVFSVIGLSCLINSNEPSKTRSYGFLYLGLGSLFRHDGWPTLVVVGISIVLFEIIRGTKKREIKKVKFGVIFVVVGLASAFLSFAIVHGSNSTPKPNWLQTSSLLADLQYVNFYNSSLLAPETKTILNKISSGDSLNGAGDCNLFNSMVFSSGFSESNANKYAYKIPQLWLRAMQSDASELMLKAHACRAKAFIPFPFSNSPGYAYWLASEIDTPNNFKLERQNIIPGLHSIQVLWSYIWESNQLYLAWPGLHVSIATFLFFVLLRQKKISTHANILITFLIARTILLIVFTVAQDFRYMYSSYFISLSLLAIFIVRTIQTPKQNRL